MRNIFLYKKVIYLFLLPVLMFSGCMFNQKGIIREYTALNYGFKEIFAVDPSRGNYFFMRIKIEGEIIGRAEVLVNDPPYNQAPRYRIFIEGAVNEEIVLEWYDNECLLHFIPEDFSVTGYLKFTVIFQ